MAVSPPPGNCQQALQDAVAVEPFHATACAPWRTCTQPTPSWKIPTLYCVVPENIHTPLPVEGPFASDPPPPWNFHLRGYVSYPPATPGVSIIF